MNGQFVTGLLNYDIMISRKSQTLHNPPSKSIDQEIERIEKQLETCERE